MKLQKPELINILVEELLKLEKLSADFDSESQYMVTEIARIISHIFHNTETSKSLLSQLKLTHLPIYCSAELYNYKSLVNYLGLLKLEHNVQLGWNYYPKLNQEELRFVSQENWWLNKKVIIDSLEASYTRSKIIKSVANADGTLDRMDTSGWKINGKLDVKINPIPATVNQIAFELLASFKNINLSKESKLHYKI
ncbi:hypothetical protein ACFOWA_17095 [Pedobacter lithocola]|uniref:COMM domain-containing protein n=1 Tax=Pedobacter lithocola TaxID=1908239 RepID=A0ABV8PEZ7_9SPHI